MILDLLHYLLIWVLVSFSLASVWICVCWLFGKGERVETTHYVEPVTRAAKRMHLRDELERAEWSFLVSPLSGGRKAERRHRG